MRQSDQVATHARRSIDDFLYPGPRPLGRDDSQLLVGRDLDVARVVYQIYNTPVVELTAPSGTGKSSILAAGAIPALEDHGFTVVTLRSWAEVRGDTPAHYYYNALKQAFADSAETATGKTEQLLDPASWPAEPDAGLRWVAQEFEDSLVIIFDQLEELMRVDQHRAQTFLNQVVSVARETTLRQVLSLRSEFKAQLNVVESQLGIRQWQWYRLDEVKPEFVRDVIRAPRTVEPRAASVEAAPSWPVDETVLDKIVGAWAGAHAHDPGIGLLHLQATLWVLEEEIGTYPQAWTWEAAERSSLFSELVTVSSDSQRREAVASSLLRYIEFALAYLEQSLHIEGNRWAGAETRYAIARFVDDLSSAGYKIPMSVDDLFLKCYEGLQDLRSDRKALQRLRRVWEQQDVIASDDAADLLQVAQASLEEWSPEGEREPLVFRERFFSGRLWQKEALEGLCELEVIFERALRWLESRGIVRITPDSNRVRLVTLIHDGFGSALNTWAEHAAKEPDFYLRALVGENGTSVLGGREQSPSRNDRGVYESFAENGPYYLVVEDRKGKAKGSALQWSGCSVDYTHFKDVVFDDCDFRGTVFFDCRFTNVEFRDCYMPGVLFISPTVCGDKGLTITDTITRTMSVTGGGSEAEAPLTFDSIMVAEINGHQERVDGLFISDFAGPWLIKNSSFKHLSIINSGTGTIRRSTLSLIQVEDLPGPVAVEASDLRMVESGVMRDGRTRYL